ncbi:MAG: hypothetical protein EON90_00880 [Brevundimonas sp.]|nr:MAG: hypothetical protein EON90_00880 [Brevundimonas sp.]
MTETYRIRSVETWAQARDDYLAGMTAEAVCSRYDLGLSIFRRRASRDGWRRIDQDDPAPADLKLRIYEDIPADEQTETARLRYVQALERGRSVEAVRWRTLWLTLHAEQRAVLAEIRADMFPDMTPQEVLDLIKEEEARREREDDDVFFRTLPPAPAAEPQPDPAGKVDDVHSTFSRVHNSGGSPPPPPSPPLVSRAERRRLLREARKAGPPQTLNASTTPVARPPDTRDPPAIA